MQNLSDNDLDNIFRKAAEDLKPAYDAAHWDELKTRLDQEKPRPGFFNRTIISLAVSGLFIGSLFTLYYFNEAGNERTGADRMLNQQEQVIAKTHKETPGKTDERTGDRSIKNPDDRTLQETATAKNETTNIPATQSNPIRNRPMDQRLSVSEANSIDASNANTPDKTTTMPHQDPVEPQVVEELPMQQEMNHGKEAHAGVIAIQEINHDQTTGETRAVKNTRPNNDDAFSDQIAEIPTSTADNRVSHTVTPDHDGEQDHASTTKPSPEQRLAAKAITDSLHDKTPLVTDSLQRESETNKAETRSKANQSFNRISIKLALSPDFSAVGYSGYENPGTNYGLLGEYHVTAKWSIVTGAIWSKKVYSGENLSYNGRTPDKTDGDCRILDIPLNIVYTFNTGKTIQFYISAGISSYIMNEENYDFHYDGSYGDPYTYSTTVKGKNNELFSVLNFSLGVQKQISPRWAIQLEPFVKHALSGIGEGKLSLNSVGGFLNLRYSFLKINNP